MSGERVKAVLSRRSLKKRGGTDKERKGRVDEWDGGVGGRGNRPGVGSGRKTEIKSENVDPLQAPPRVQIDGYFLHIPNRIRI